MGYWITKFITTDLPTVGKMEDIEASGQTNYAISLPDGYTFDALGSSPSVGTGQQIKVQVMVVAATESALNAACAALLALAKLKGTLYRTPDGGLANSEWILARCDRVTSERQVRNRLWVNLTLYFRLLSPSWYGAENNSTKTLSSSTINTTVTAAGNTAQRSVLFELTAQSSAITQIDIKNTTTGHKCHLVWAGSLGAGETLTIDTGAHTILKGSSDAYSGFSYGSTHEIPDWFRLTPGANTLQIIRTGGGSTSTLEITFDEALA